MYVFTLSPKLDTVLQDRGKRKLNQWEKDRIKHHYSIGIASPTFGVIIDNSQQTPEETANQIFQMIEGKQVNSN